MGKIAVELDDEEMERLLAAANAVRAIDQHSLPADDTRAKRLAAIMSVHGIWKDDPTKPKDPVAYQREVRAEW